jgi:methylmalonyl-CoA mutase N-terminal domain/subunit
MALCSYDEAYTIPSKKAAKISLRTMQILADEMGLCDTVDPLSGSYYIEWLTKKMEEKIIKCMDLVEKQGGMIKAVESGYIQKEISYQAYLHEKQIQEGKIPKIGVNKYISDDEEQREIEFHPFDPDVANNQVKRLKEVKATRDNHKVKEVLSNLKQVSQTKENVMPVIIDAVRSYATLGEITGILREVFGEFKEPINI